MTKSIPSTLTLAEIVALIEAANVASVLHPARAADHYRKAATVLSREVPDIVDDLHKAAREMERHGGVTEGDSK